MRRNILAILVCLSIAFATSCTLRDLVTWPLEMAGGSVISEVVGLGGMLAIEAVYTAAEISKAKNTAEWIGMKVHNITDSLCGKYGIGPNEKGVVVTKVKSKSVAGQIGFRKGDLIKRINQFETNDVKEFYEATKRIRDEDAKEISFTIIRQGSLQQIKCTVQEK